MTAARIILHGKAAANADVRKAVAVLRERGHAIEVRVTWESGDAARLAREAVADARAGTVATIIAGGGDGTINEVFASAYRAGLPQACVLGVLPLGTANDFAHSTLIPVADMTAALELALEGTARPIDVALVDGRPFVNVLSGGFGSRVTVETDPELKKRLGGLAYVLTGVTRFSELSASRGRFTAPDFSWEGPFLAVAIGNGRQAGGGIPLCPDAMLDDGMLDLMVMPELDRAARLDAFAALLRGGVDSLRAQLVTTRAPWIVYEAEEPLHVNLDGEPMKLKRFRAECVAGALSVRLGDTPLVSPAA